MLSVITEHGATIFAVLFALSEAIGMIPSVKSSSVFQAIYNGLVWLKANVFKSPSA